MTKTDISRRHRGSLRGKLSDQQLLPAEVHLHMEKTVAELPAIQHLCWMLGNLLARQTDEIGVLHLAIPAGVRLSARLSPLMSSRDVDLRTAMHAGIQRINPTLLNTGQAARYLISIRIGPGALGGGDLALATSALGWAGYVGRQPTDTIGEDDSPIGSYVAACLTAAEVFKFVRGARESNSTPSESLWFDAAALQISTNPPLWLPLSTEIELPAAVIVGAGAVANGLLQTLYALPQARGSLTLIDKDPEGITDTNLNRCVLFGLDHIGRPKASTAASVFDNSMINVEPVDASWESWYASHGEAMIDFVISAVDTNHARHAIQDALPRVVLGGSTNEMRAQINVYDPLAGGPCLRCRNRPESFAADKDVIDRLRQLSVDERHLQAVQLGIDPATLDLFLSDPIVHCGKISGSALQKFADNSGAEEWSVGFVSAFAGILLATEYIRMSTPSAKPVLSGCLNTYPFQFWHPAKAAVNRPTWTPPEDGCMCQSSVFRSAMAAVWRS